MIINLICDPVGRDLNLKNRGFYDFEFESVEEGIA